MLIGEGGLPVATTFSPDRLVEAYINILERHLAITRVLEKRRSRRRRREELSSSGLSGSSSESDTPTSTDKTSNREEKKALKKLTKEVETALRIGENEYPAEHLYECERLLVEYQKWHDPEDGSEQPATAPMGIRQFIKKHLAVSDSPITSAYDQAHVKGNSKERKHVTFLLNRMAYKASKIAKERLARTGKELNRHGRIRKGAELSKKERKESIEGERKWAGEIRWLSILLGKGTSGYRKYSWS